MSRTGTNPSFYLQEKDQFAICLIVVSDGVHDHSIVVEADMTRTFEEITVKAPLFARQISNLESGNNTLFSFQLEWDFNVCEQRFVFHSDILNGCRVQEESGKDPWNRRMLPRGS